MLNSLLDALRRYDMVHPGDTVICAVSGGKDSMALLWSFYLLREKLDIQLECAHFNHGLRGEESDRDQAFVQDFCQSYGIPFHTESGCVAAGKKGLEAAARDARYGFLNSLNGKIATAHTADDNAETVLMHLVRGTGLKGLGGIAPVSGMLIRPMLNVTRAQVEAFVEEYHLQFVEDSTNATDDFLRNRLRHHVLPLLKVENPRFAQSLSETAQSLRKDSALLDTLRHAPWEDVYALRAMEDAGRSRVLAAFLEECGVKEPSRRHIALAQSLVFSENPSARADFPGGIVIGREYEKLISYKDTKADWSVCLPCPGEVELAELGLKVVCEFAEIPVNTPDSFTVYPQGKLILRNRKPGDALCTKGGTKSLKQRFIDRKIPQAQRMLIPVAADEQGLLGVFGFGADLRKLKEENGVTITFIKR